MQLIEIPDSSYENDEGDEEILEIFVEEVDEVLENLHNYFNAWKNEPDNSEALTELRRCFHTLKGSGRLVGAMVIGELCWHFENMLNKVIEGTLSVNNDMLSLIEQAEKVLPSLLEQFQHKQPPSDAVVLLIYRANYLTHHADQSLGELSLEDELSLGGENLDMDMDLPDLPDIELDELPVEDAIQDAPDELMVRFLDDGKEILKKTQSLLDRWIMAPRDMRLIDGLQCELHTLKGSVNMVGIAPMGKLSHHLENILKQIHEGTVQPNTRVQQLVQQSVDELTDMLSAVRSGALLDCPSEFIEQLNDAALESEQESNAPDELMEIFLEEAEEILEKTQLLLERWITAPNDQQLIKEIQRELHTIKGGARMVGITPMGDLSHHLEDIFRQIIEQTAQPNTRLQDLVQQSMEELVSMLESVRSGVSVNNPTELIEQIKAALGLDKAAPPTSIASAPPPSKANFDEEGSRVRAILIDKLTQIARGLYLSRTHIVQQQGAFKNHLGDLEQTLIRLDSQLEQEREAPLSRPLTAILNHLKKIQNAFKNQTQQSDSLLIQQSRIGVELQDCIMRTRMISPTDSDEEVDIEPPHAKKTIMIVNESVAVRKVTIGLLGRQGFEVLTAKNGIEAVAQLRDKIPDLMVVDTKLQRMDGYKLATQVRNHPDWKHLPIIMIIAHAGTQSRKKTEELGINRFLGKPYKESELLENINALLAEMEAKKAEMETKKTIMLVDDSIAVRRVTSSLLKRQGFQVHTAKDGIDAIGQLQENVPDLMLLDVEMPRMDGYELAAQVRNHSDWKHLPLIMITSRSGAKHKEKSDKIGINRFLGKPYKESELLENINALLAEMGT